MLTREQILSRISERDAAAAEARDWMRSDRCMMPKMARACVDLHEDSARRMRERLARRAVLAISGR